MSASRLIRLVVLLLVASIVAGCGKGGGGSSSANVRFVNMLVDVGAINVNVTTPGASLANSVPNISNIQQNGTSGFASLTPGTLQVRLTLANSKQVIYDSGPLTFLNQASYGLVAYTRGSSTLDNAALLT